MCNGDEIRLNLNLKRLLRFHERSNSTATVIGANANKLYNEAVLKIREGRVFDVIIDDIRYLAKPDEVDIASAGMMVINREAIKYFDQKYGTGWNSILIPLVNGGQLCAYVDQNVAFFNINTGSQVAVAREYLRQNTADCQRCK